MQINIIKKYLVGGLAFLMLIALITTGVENVVLKDKVVQLETDKITLSAEALIKRMEVSALVESIGQQEQTIKTFESSAKQMAAARQQAQQEAAGRIAQLSGQVARLEQDKGASCTVAGIGQTILNEVLP